MRAANPEKIRASNAAWRSDPKNKLKKKASDAKWRAENPERAKANSVAWSALNQDKIKANGLRWIRSKMAENPGKYKAQSRKAVLAQYGLTVESYAAMLLSQGGVCKICGGEQINGKNLAVDHCHATGIVRGLLCHHCNAALGHMMDTPSRLEAAAKYLRAAETSPCLVSLETP